MLTEQQRQKLVTAVGQEQAVRRLSTQVMEETEVYDKEAVMHPFMYVDSEQRSMRSSPSLALWNFIEFSFRSF